MELKRFKEKNNKKIGIILFTIACILLVGGVVLYRTFAIFETNDEFDIINGVVQSKGDISFNFYINDVLVKEVPTKESGKIFDSYHSYCENGTNISWNAHSWEASIKNIKESPTKCHLKFIDGYEESILNGAVPDLGNGKLTPITIEENGIVHKADLTNKDNPWYKYEEKKWANSVILKENSYELLKANGKINSDPILEEDSLHLDGADDYVNLGLANYDFKDQITLALTVKFNQYNDTGYQDLLGNWEGAGGGLTMLKDNHIHGGNFFIVGHSDYETPVPSDEKVVLDQYYTVVVTYNGERIVMYINGKKQQVERVVSGNITPSTASFAIGSNISVDGRPEISANINVKQAAIFNRAISEEEINEISNENFKITNSKGLLKYVDFTKKEYQSNEVIPEDNIESYFVWIPRYRYQLFSENLDSYSGIAKSFQATNVSEIDSLANPINITFETNDVNPSKGNTKNNWLTHPAFTSFNSNGMWVGKFESGYKGAQEKSQSEVDERNAQMLIVKPNVYSWRKFHVANAFYTSYDYQRELDSHMIKNTEWGAITYLSESIYGVCDDGTCKEIRMNNNSNCITGFAANYETTCGYTGIEENCSRFENVAPFQDGVNAWNYNNSSSQIASTTGNYSGVYDMSGGAWEYVMGIMQSSPTNSTPTAGKDASLNSEFNGPYSNATGERNEWIAMA